MITGDILNRICDRIESLECKIKELERFQGITHAQYQNNIKSNKPYKCPLCQSAGIVFDITDKTGLPYLCSEKIKCPPCDGTGIVWG